MTLSNGATIVIAAGTLTGTVNVPVAASDDVYVDPTSVSASISGTSGGGIGIVIDATPAVTTITDTIDTTTVSLSATPSVAEGGSIVYTATLTNAAASPVSVTLSNGATINIAAGATSGTASVPAPGDDVYVDAGNVSATITAATGGNFEALAHQPGRRDDRDHRHDRHHHGQPDCDRVGGRRRQHRLHRVADQRGPVGGDGDAVQRCHDHHRHGRQQRQRECAGPGR